MAESKGFFRRTPVHLRVASLLDHVGVNSPPDCFLPQTTSAPSLFDSLYLFLPMQKAGVETCGLFIFVGTQASISVPPWNLNLIRPSDRAEFFMALQSFLIFQSRSPRINGIADRSELSATGRVYSMNRSVIRFEYLPSSLGIPPFAIKSLSAAVSEDENLTTA